MDFFILSRELGVRGRTWRAPPASRRDGVGVVHPERTEMRRPPRRGGPPILTPPSCSRAPFHDQGAQKRGNAHPPLRVPPLLRSPPVRTRCGQRRGCMRTAPPLPLLLSHSRLQGDGGTATPARTSSARPPVRTSQRGGCEHNPVCCPVCTTPAPHLSHATLRTPSRMRDDERVAPERWGAGVVHAERTRGCAHTPCGRGTPRFARGSRGPIARARAHSGVNPVARPHANGGRVPGAPAACPLPSLHPRSLLERAPPSLHPVCAGREGAQGGRRRLQVAAHPPVGCYARLGERDAKGLCCARVCALLGRERGPRLYTNGGLIGGGGPCAQSSST